jgi:hypothetical protein
MELYPCKWIAWISEVARASRFGCCCILCPYFIDAEFDLPSTFVLLVCIPLPVNAR